MARISEVPAITSSYLMLHSIAEFLPETYDAKPFAVMHEAVSSYMDNEGEIFVKLLEKWSVNYYLEYRDTFRQAGEQDPILPEKHVVEEAVILHIIDGYQNIDIEIRMQMDWLPLKDGWEDDFQKGLFGFMP